MTDIKETIQLTNMGNSEHMGNLEITEDYLCAIKEFKPYYEKFVGHPVEDRLFFQDAGALLLSPYRKQPIWSHPLTRTALLGAGSLATTLVVGFALSHDAGNQPTADNFVSPAASPSQPDYREQASRTLPTPRVASPALAQVEFSNSQVAQAQAKLSQSAVAISPQFKVPPQLPLVLPPIEQPDAIALEATGQPTPQSSPTASEQVTTLSQPSQNREGGSLQPAASVSAQSTDRPVSADSRAIASPQPLPGSNTPLRTGSSLGETPASSETLPSQLTTTLPPWVNSNIAPPETQPSTVSQPSTAPQLSTPSPNASPPLGAEAISNEQVAPPAGQPQFNDGYSPDSARARAGGSWAINSSIAFRAIVSRNYGISEPEASNLHAQVARSQAIAAPYSTSRKSLSPKAE